MKEELGVNKVQSFLVPFLAGGLLGAGIALLLAPKSGRELRKDIKDMAEKTGEKVTATAEKGRALYEDGTLAIKNAIEAGKSAYVEAVEKHRKAA